MTPSVLRRSLKCAILPLLALSSSAFAVTPAGIVYESEAISTPDTAWELNKRSADHWMLWTEEDDINAKRSGGAVLASPAVAEDRMSPEEGAPPLHSVVSDLKPGAYLVYVSAPGARPLAYSLDGTTWFKYTGGELALGVREIPDGRFELWVDDRYANPANMAGAGYYDYIRFVPVPPSATSVQRYAPSQSLEEHLKKDENSFIVPATATTDWVGFEKEGEVIRGSEPGHRFSYVFDREGTFYLAVLMVDDEDGIEQLEATFKGEDIGCIMADTATDEALFSFKNPIRVAPGDTLTFTCETSVSCYRVKKLYFAKEFVVPPPPSFQYVEPWSPEPGKVDVCWTTSDIVATGTLEYGVGEFSQKTEPSAYEGRNHRVRLSGLDPSKEYRARIVTEYQGAQVLSEPVTFVPRPLEPAQTQPLDVTLAVPEPTERPRTAWPATVGMPFSKGTLAKVNDLALVGKDGATIPLQAECFSRWPDGSVKWATLSWLADSASSGQAPSYHLKDIAAATPSASTDVDTVVHLEADGDAWRINTGALAFDIGKQTPALFNNVGFDRNGDGAVTEDERIKASPLGANLKLEAGDGTFFTCGPPEADSFEVEVNGPVRAIVKWSGPLVDKQGKPGWWYLVRITLWKSAPTMGVNVSVCNDQAEPTFRPVTALALRVPLDGEGGVRGAFDGANIEPDADGLWIHQDKDNHFSARSSSGVSEGTRAAGVATAEDNRSRVTVLMRDFWQTYPSGCAIKPDGIHVRLLPTLAPDTYSAPEEAPWFYKLYAWFKDGKYMLRAGQLTQHEVLVHYTVPGADTQAVAHWLARPLLPLAAPEYLCATGVLGRPLFPRTPGKWDDYEAFFDAGFEQTLQDRETRRSYGWMHFGDWYGERSCNYGNNEYSMDFALAMQWMRTGDRRCFDRGLEMARHYSTVDTLHGAFTDSANGLAWEHCFNHNGTSLKPSELRIPADDKEAQAYMNEYESALNGWIDRQGHIFEPGIWLYAALTGDPWLRYVAERVCENQAEKLTPAFNFTIERCGGWPLINACAAYNTSGNPYYLNAARLMVQRCLERQDPDTGGWLHTPPVGETDNVPVLGGKAFAVGILTHGLLRYLEVEPQDRPDVRHMIVRGVDWLMNESWCPGKGFRYISNCPKYRDTGSRGNTSVLNAEAVAFAYEETGDAKYLAFWREMMDGVWEDSGSGMGKSFTQSVRQSLFGLDRVLQWDITSSKNLISGEAK